MYQKCKNAGTDIQKEDTVQPSLGLTVLAKYIQSAFSAVLRYFRFLMGISKVPRWFGQEGNSQIRPHCRKESFSGRNISQFRFFLSSIKTESGWVLSLLHLFK